jgi:hypothetical protein
MKRSFQFLLIAIFSTLSSAAQLFYPVDSIAPELRAGATAVIRNSQIKVTVIDENSATMKYKTAVTLLNDDAEDLTIIGIPYDKLSKVSAIKASAYNAAGKLIWTLKTFDIYDFKDFSGPEYLDDSRKKVFEFPTFSFPFTIEFSYEMQMKDLFLSPSYYLQADPEISVETAGLQYIVPEKIGFNFKERNLKSPTDSIHKGDKIYMSWAEINLPAQRQQTYAPDLDEKMPVVYATPLRTDLKGYKGSFATWRDYGIWMMQLLQGRDILDPQYAEAARNLIKDIPDRRSKIKALYEYMQKNTRYFSIAFGIGGKQPIPANEVAKNGYGDCKALSNYMRALLKVAGIESYYTLVKAGEFENIEADFPCNQFNHAILCVPDGKDTIWLECTDQTSPFNYLGSFTCDRSVLAITPDGGKLLKTPVYGRNFNTDKSFTDIQLFGSGDAKISVEFENKGLRYEVLEAVSESKEDYRKSWLAKQFGFTSFEIENETYSFDKSGAVPIGKANFKILLRDLASKTSDRLYVAPCFLSSTPMVWNDTSEIEIELDYETFDSVRIEIPIGYKVEYMPEMKTINSRFGNYFSSISADNKYIYFRRRFTFNKALYPKEKFPEFFDFVTRISEAEDQMVVLKNN